MSNVTQSLSSHCLLSDLQIMMNETCVPVNGTDCGGTTSPVGLAVGLTFLFLALGIAAAVAVYTQRDKLRNMLQPGQGRSQKKEEHTERPQDNSSQYTSMIRAPSETQAPIYENFTGQNAGNRTMADMGR